MNSNKLFIFNNLNLNKNTMQAQKLINNMEGYTKKKSNSTNSFVSMEVFVKVSLNI